MKTWQKEHLLISHGLLLWYCISALHFPETTCQSNSVGGPVLSFYIYFLLLTFEFLCCIFFFCVSVRMAIAAYANSSSSAYSKQTENTPCSQERAARHRVCLEQQIEKLSWTCCRPNYRQWSSTNICTNEMALFVAQTEPHENHGNVTDYDFKA